MSIPFILYNNLLPGASLITVTSEAVGYEKENAYDWLTWDHWKPSAAGTVYYTVDLGSAQAVNAWGVVAHNLGANGASIKLQYSTDNFAADINDVAVATSPTSTESIMKTFASLTKRYWRWEIVSASAASQIGLLFLGVKMEMASGLKVGYVPDDLAPLYESEYNLSDESALLGSSNYKKPIKNKMSFKALTPAWVRSTWEPLLRHVEQGKGFLYQAQPVDYPNNVIYAIADKKKLKAPKYSHSNFMSVELAYIGVVE